MPENATPEQNADQTDAVDRRQTVRYPAAGRGRLRFGGSGADIEIRLIDISTGGISAKAQQPVTIGARCKLALEVHSNAIERIACSALVRRCVLKGSHHEVGLQFVDFEGDGQAVLARVYAQRRQFVTGR